MANCFGEECYTPEEGTTICHMPCASLADRFVDWDLGWNINNKNWVFGPAWDGVYKETTQIFAYSCSDNNIVGDYTLHSIRVYCHGESITTVENSPTRPEIPASWGDTYVSTTSQSTSHDFISSNNGLSVDAGVYDPDGWVQDGHDPQKWRIRRRNYDIMPIYKLNTIPLPECPEGTSLNPNTGTCDIIEGWEWDDLDKTYVLLPGWVEYPPGSGIYIKRGSVIAEDMVKYLYKQDDNRRKIVTFQTDIQGLVPQYLDKIMVSHSAVQWGEAGEVYSRTLDNLVLSDALVDLSAGQTIVFRDIDGSVSAAYAIIITDATHITVTGMPAFVTLNTFYTIQGIGTAREFLVIAVKPNGDSVQIDCVNYNEEVYN